MIFTMSKCFLRGTVALALVVYATIFSSANAAPVNYGDFTGSSVMYLDVTETANTPGDTEPLYGDGDAAAPFNPSILGNTLDFDPGGFSASAIISPSDLTDGQLNFTLMGVPGSAITQFEISESGDYSLLGAGTDVTQIIYGLGITSVVVVEVDGVPLGAPVVLPAASVGGGDDLSSGLDILTPWDLSLLYDVNAALNGAGVSFTAGATKIEIAINNTLAAISQIASIAFVAKKDFRVDVTTEPFDPHTIVPEPGTLVLLCLALGSMQLGGRLRA